jgi:hypothetical protein
VIDNKSSKHTHSIVYTGSIFPNVIRKACQDNNNFVSVSKNGIKFKQFEAIFKQIYNRDYTLNVTSIQNSANGFRGLADKIL